MGVLRKQKSHRSSVETRFGFHMAEDRGFSGTTVFITEVVQNYLK
jgi:hypothetical protein